MSKNTFCCEDHVSTSEMVTQFTNTRYFLFENYDSMFEYDEEDIPSRFDLENKHE